MNSPPPQPPPQPPPLDLAAARAALGRFQALNRERLRRSREVLEPDQQPFLDLLPLLIHINDVRLPGFVSELAPSGVSGYLPPAKLIEQARRLFPGFAYSRRAQLSYRIDALYLMGSSGSIAHSAGSDFDVWVCHRPDLTPLDIETLEQKLWRLERWAATLGLEAHFFLVEQEAFRAGRHGTVTEESSGSAQHHLLLDEFYRTGVWLAGRQPVWWLVPPEREACYPGTVRELYAAGAAERSEVMDFGGVAGVPAGEFYGAAVWQLYKGIDSPYKSLLKILVMEAYAAGYPQGELLSQRFKRAVYEGESDPDRLDPYLLLYRRIEEHLAGDPERLELARRGFYFKLGLPLGPTARGGGDGWQHRRLAALVAEWGWQEPHLLYLDSRPEWKADRLVAERATLVSAFTRSYRALAEFARANAEAMTIGRADLALLGRKLQAAFERRPGKVEFINPGISQRVGEATLTLRPLAEEEGGGWQLYRGRVEEGRLALVKPLRGFAGLVELLAWCHFNRILEESTELFLLGRGGAVPRERELKALLKYLRRSYPEGRFAGGGMEELRQAPRVVGAALFVNVGYDPLDRQAERGVLLTDSDIDPLCYGAAQENQAASCDLLLATSWHEVLCLRHRGPAALPQALGEFLARTPPGDGRPPPLEVHSYSSARSGAIVRRVTELIDDLFGYLYEGPEAAVLRYLLRLGGEFHRLELRGGAFSHRVLPGQEALLEELAAEQDEFSPLRIEPQALPGSPLPLIFERNRPGEIQLYFRPVVGNAQVLVLDERGSLFQQTVEYRSAAALLHHFERFFLALGRTREEIEFHRLRFQEERWRAEYVYPEEGRPAQRYFGLQVTVEPGEGDEPRYTIACEGSRFTAERHGDGLFHAVAEHLMALRSRFERYPFYVTAVDLERLPQGRGAATVRYLAYKRRVEERLNQELRSIV